METRRGYANRGSVVKSMNGEFLNKFGALRTALETPSIGEQVGQLSARSQARTWSGRSPQATWGSAAPTA